MNSGDTTASDAKAPVEAHPPLWRNRDYMLLWSGQVVSVFGSTMSGIASPLLVLALTGGNYAAAGVVGMLSALPYVVFSLPAGAMVDRWNRKRAMIISDLIRAAAFSTIPIAMLMGWLTVWQLYALALVEGTMYVFFNIAEVAALPRVVPKSQIGDANAQNMATFGVAGLIGPGLAGFLYQNVGRAVPFVVDAVSYLLSALSLLFIRTNFQAERSVPRTERKMGREIKEGLLWAWREPLVRLTSFLSGGLNVIGAATYLLLIFLADGMGADETAVGVIFTISSVGGILGAALGGWVHRRFTMRTIVLATLWINAILVPIYAVAPNVAVLGIIGAFSFFMVPVYSVAVLSYRLALIPDALQGRVNSAVRLVAFGFQPLGSAVAGLLLENTGALPTIGFFSAFALMLAFIALFSPTIRAATGVGPPEPQTTEEETRGISAA